MIGDLLTSSGDLAGRLRDLMSSVEDRLAAEVASDEPDIHELTSHLAQAGGKRLRPALCLLTSFLGPDPGNEAAEISATVVELTHLATLYHDDVMDEAPMRRGVPSVQRLAGNSAAILSGDVLFAKASTLTSILGPDAVRLHAQTFERLCYGQLRETLGPAEGMDTKEHYIQVLADKTGSLVAASARYGVIASGGTEEVKEAVTNFGEKVGVAFQLADDVIDIMSDGDVTGKTPGTDLREGVDTMPIILLRQRAERDQIDEQGAKILSLLDSAKEEDIERTVELLREHSVMDEVRDLAFAWSEDAVACLDPLPEGDVVDALRAFARLMVERIR